MTIRTPLVQTINGLRTYDEEQKKKKTDRLELAKIIVPSATTIITALLVINAEATGIITSKAFSFIPKGRF